MATLAYVHPYEDAICGILGGDDSIVAFPIKTIIVDCTQQLA